jgi:hypothetical protein
MQTAFTKSIDLINTKTTDYTAKTTDLINAKTMTRISKFVSALYNKTLTESQMRAVLQIARDISTNYNKDAHAFVMDVAVAYYQQLIQNIPQEIDVQEYISEELYKITPSEGINLQAAPISRRIINKTSINSVISIDQATALSLIFNPSTRHKKTYLALDSRYATFLDNNTRLQWIVSNTPNLQDGTANYIGAIRNIIEMRIHSFIVPHFTSPVNRGFLLVEEFAGQSFISPAGMNFHYVGLLNDLLNPIPLDRRAIATAAIGFTPDYFTQGKTEVLSGYRFNEGTYRFYHPITLVDSLTLRFHDGINAIPLPKFRTDSVLITDFYLRDLDFFPSDDYYGRIVLKFPTPHHLQPTQYRPNDTPHFYSLRFIGFNTTDPISDAAIIEFMNNNEFTHINRLSDDELIIRPRWVNPFNGPHPYYIEAGAAYINPGFSYLLVGDLLPVSIEMNSFRTFFNIELTYLDD